MRILFDQGAPVPLRKSLANHEVVTAFEMGWQTLQNGDLLAAAEQAGFEVLVTTDQNLGHQQNLRDRKLGIVVLSTTNWRRISAHTSLVVAALGAVSAGQIKVVEIPR